MMHVLMKVLLVCLLSYGLSWQAKASELQVAKRVCEAISHDEVQCRWLVAQQKSLRSLQIFSSLPNSSIKKIKANSWSVQHRAPLVKRPRWDCSLLFASEPQAVSPTMRAEVAVMAMPRFASLKLPGKTEAYAQVRVQVAKSWFGPIKANKSGKFVIKLLVPPAVNYATAEFRDLADNVSTKKIKLYPPKQERIFLFALDEKLPAQAEQGSLLFGTVLDYAGNAYWPSSASITTDHGNLQTLWQQNGVQVWYLSFTGELPSSRALIVQAKYKQYRKKLRIALTSGAIDSVRLRIMPQPAYIGHVEKLKAAVSFEDRYANLVFAQDPKLNIFLQGKAQAVKNRRVMPEHYLFEWEPPQSPGVYQVNMQASADSGDCFRPQLAAPTNEKARYAVFDYAGQRCQLEHVKELGLEDSVSDIQAIETGMVSIDGVSYFYSERAAWPWLQVGNFKLAKNVQAKNSVYLLPKGAMVFDVSLQKREQHSYGLTFCAANSELQADALWHELSCGQTSSKKYIATLKGCLQSIIDLAACGDKQSLRVMFGMQGKALMYEREFPLNSMVEP